MFKILVIFIGCMMLTSGINAAKTPLGATRKLVDKIEGNKSKTEKRSSSKKISHKIEQKIEQKICPVMGGKINPMLYYTYRKTIFACSRDCINTIGKNPEKYLPKVQKEIGASKKKTQKTCPVIGKKINPMLYYTYKKKIYVCCGGCIWTIKKKPDMYLAKVQKEIAKSKKK